MADYVGPNPTQENPIVVGVDSDRAEDIIGALSSDTARSIMAELQESPSTPSEIAKALDTSVQNTKYHINRLEDAGLIHVDDMKYSPKGREMNVYAPNNQPFIFYTGTQDKTKIIRNALKRFFAGFLVLGFASVALQLVWNSFLGPGMDASQDAEPSVMDNGSISGDESPEAQDDAVGSIGGNESQTLQEENEMLRKESGLHSNNPEAEPDALPDAFIENIHDFIEWVLGGLTPGTAFFLGGLMVLAVSVVYYYHENTKWGD